MKSGDVYLRIEKEWDLNELAALSKLYTQCYSLVFSLSDFDIESEDERFIDWYQGIYANYPWRGGFSTVNFYHNLYLRMPYEARPTIQEILYASPGFIKLKEALLAAGMLAGIVAAVTSSIDDIHHTYNNIQHGMSQRKLTKLEVELKQLELDKAKLEFIGESKNQLSDMMEIPQTMQSELFRRCEGNELMELKILMSFHRRIEPLAIMQDSGMLKIEQLGKTEILPMHVFKRSFDPMLELLKKHRVKYQIQQVRPVQPMASSGIIEILLSPSMWGALAAIIIMFIKAKYGREVIITTKDGKVLHAKGLTEKEVEPILREAMNLTAIDTSKNGSDQQ